MSCYFRQQMKSTAYGVERRCRNLCWPGMTGANAKLRQYTMANVTVGVREKGLYGTFPLFVFIMGSFEVLLKRGCMV